MAFALKIRTLTPSGIKCRVWEMSHFVLSVHRVGQ